MKKIIRTLLITLASVMLFAISAYADSADFSEAEKKITVSGAAGSAYADKYVTLLMANCDLSSDIQPSNIKFVNEFATDQNGDYSVTFPYKGDLTDCKIYLNCGGKSLTLSINNISAISEGIEINAELGRTAVDCSFKFGPGSGDCKVFYAAYDADNALVSVKSENVSVPSEGIEFERSLPVPANTAYVKIFTWENMSNMIPVIPEVNGERSKYINYRTPVTNVFKKLSQENKANIVFLGGSVTDGYGASSQNETSWRAKIGKWFTTEYPTADIKLVNSAMGGTGSKLGMYRLQRDVTAYNPDLVFVMFSINDVYAQATQEEAQAQMETIIYDLRTALPETDIVILYDIDNATAKYCRDNNVMNYPMVQYHENIAEYYGISSVNMGKVLADSIDIDTQWDEYVKDAVHPLDKGYAIYAETVKNFLDGERKSADLTGALTTYTVPENAYTERISHNMLEFKDMTLSSNNGWEIKSDKYWSNYRYALCSGNLGDTFSFKVTGTEINLHIYGLMSGTPVIDYSIDGTEYANKKLSGHPVLLAGGLENTEHTVTIKNASGTEIGLYGVMYK